MFNGQPNGNLNGSIPFAPFGFPPMVTPPPPMPAFMFSPPPTAPAGLDQLSDEELRLLEGNERRNVEERIKVSFNILIFSHRRIYYILSTF